MSVFFGLKNVLATSGGHTDTLNGEVVFQHAALLLGFYSNHASFLSQEHETDRPTRRGRIRASLNALTLIAGRIYV